METNHDNLHTPEAELPESESESEPEPPEADLEPPEEDPKDYVTVKKHPVRKEYQIRRQKHKDLLQQYCAMQKHWPTSKVVMTQ